MAKKFYNVVLIAGISTVATSEASNAVNAIISHNAMVRVKGMSVRKTSSGNSPNLFTLTRYKYRNRP